ncbi:MAG: hypothetical protein A2464_02810 [Deltaproteobacteria bacterium RIFOXYC2_FULL_48_10]|nr:MAG: hypothetical protein A2464_02810 [Deltaproteobacteria bacterium RIFOXYC2_FULL_48_10]
MQLKSPFSVLRIISLQSLQKLLGFVMGRPFTSVMMEATPVAPAKESWISWISFTSKRDSKEGMSGFE